MTPEAEGAVAASPATALTDCVQALALLRQQGADRLKPVDFHYMEALAHRLIDQSPNVRSILERKLAVALASYQGYHERVQSDGADANPHTPTPQTTAQTPLGQLIQSLAHHTTEPEVSPWAAAGSARTELKSVRNFRNTWSKLSAQKQVSQAMGQAPKNAGPINSHMLVLRSLELMRDISPDYLNRFMSYADTLLCLDQSGLNAKAPQTKPLASAKPRPRAPGRT